MLPSLFLECNFLKTIGDFFPYSKHMKLYISITYGQGEKGATKHFDLSKNIFLVLIWNCQYGKNHDLSSFVTVMTIHICSKYRIDIYEKDTC